MLLHLNDRHKFIEYLKYCQRENNTHKTLECLVFILEEFIDRIESTYDYRDSNNNWMIELLGGLKEIIEALKAIPHDDNDQLSENIQILEDYQMSIDCNYLDEYVKAQSIVRSYIIQRVKGLVNWKNEDVIQVVKDLWTEAFSVLEMISKNPNAFDLYLEMRSYLLEQIDEYESDIALTKTALDPEKKKIIDEIIKEYKNKIIAMDVRELPEFPIVE